MSQKRFDRSYNRYLLLRGYDPSSSKLLILKRALVDSWAEPGFHKFWRVWNPGIGHLLYSLYRFLGGNRNRVLATMLVFATCGLFHDVLVMLIFRRPFFAFSMAFILFGVLSVLNRAAEPFLRQGSWPRTLNVLCNAACLSASICLAVPLQMALFR
jgi:hypothetical protein